MEEKPDSGVQDGAPSGGKLSAHGGEADLPEGEWALQGPRESVSTYASRVMIRLREYEDASKLIRRLREELRCTSAKAAGASKPRKAKLQAEVKRLSSEIQRLELRKATIREQSGPFKEKLINEDRYREMADTREQRQMGLQPESQVDDESDDDQQQAPPGSLQSHPQATCSELPAGQATVTSGRSSAGSGEDSDSSGQGGALMAEIKLLESPVCLQNFHLGDDLPEEAPGGHKKAKKTKPKLQEAGWVIEGFPWTREQGLLLQMNGTSPDHIVVLDAPDIVLIERNMGKRIDPSTGEIYHTTFDWPEEPEVQRNLVEPAGISEEETGKRLLEYQRNIPGILRAFPNIYKKINADQPCMDVFSQVLTFVLSKPRTLAPYTPRILLYGPPGSVSCGQILKEAVADQTKFGLLIEPYIQSEQQVPDSLVLRMLGDRLSRLDCAARGWVLHGFPRDAEQAALLTDAGFMPNRIFFLDIPDDVAIERLSLRMTDPMSGERYHSLYRPAPRVEVHERLQQKPADSEQKVQARLDMYHASAEDLEEFYQDVIHVNADQDPHTVWEFIESCVVRPRPQRVPGELASP
ncbi:adenylate kinase 8 isoform X2 [Phyllobates terribilis]|uniref:adenylate kinase 8 isoform X2 n=1 Tax=Phyllobates terribilis TaxID=111132 RepID=UPI003CCAC629